MEMSQIRYVLAAAKTLNFTKAAAECNITQPALTKAVKTLEGELGTPLFHREGKRILLNGFGKSMLPHLQHIVDEAEATKALAENFKLLNQVPIRVGVMSTIGHVRLSRFLAEFQQDFEGIEVAVNEADAKALGSKLYEGELDLAVLNPLEVMSDEFHAHDLYRERYVVVFPPGHRLAALNTVKLSDLSGERYVDRLACEMREMVMGACQEMEVELYARFRSEREDWVQAMVLANIGFAFMPEYAVTLPELLQRPLIEPEVERTISLISVRGRPFTPAVSAFVRAAKRFVWPG